MKKQEIINKLYSSIKDKSGLLTIFQSLTVGEDFRSKAEYKDVGIEEFKLAGAITCTGNNKYLYVEAVVDTLSVVYCIENGIVPVVCSKSNEELAKKLLGVKINRVENLESLFKFYNDYFENKQEVVEENDIDLDEDISTSTTPVSFEREDVENIGTSDFDDSSDTGSLEESSDLDEELEEYEEPEEELEEEPEEELEEEKLEKLEEEEDDEEPEADDDLLNSVIETVYSDRIFTAINQVLMRYDLLFESGYDLKRPYGILSPSEDRDDCASVYYVNSEGYRKDRCIGVPGKKHNDITISTASKLNDLLTKDKVRMSNSRVIHNVSLDIYQAYEMGGDFLVYFPYKLLEYCYGRKSRMGKEQNEDGFYKEYITYAKSEHGNVWSAFRKDIEADLRKVFKTSIYTYLVNFYKLEAKKDYEDLFRDVSQPRILNDVEKFITYIKNCLSYCRVIIDYKVNNGFPVAFKIRITDDNDQFGYNFTPTIVSEVFNEDGGSKGMPMSSGLNESDSRSYKVYEYAHEFNHVLSSAMPLFAYRAYLSLKEKGEDVTYKDMIIGQSEDGTILKNGTHGMKMEKNLFHYIIAGSRSGKGVMTLNMLAAALVSNKAVFYLDNKPDMLSLLTHMAKTSDYTLNGPAIFGVNGTNYEDDEKKEFVDQNSWINPEHIPSEATEMFGPPLWSTYGELFYLRAFNFVMGLILARGLPGTYYKNPELNGENGIFLVCDEISKVQVNFKSFMQILCGYIPPQNNLFKKSSKELVMAYNGLDESKSSTYTKFYKLQSAFIDGFSLKKFYALSLLKSLANGVRYISGKSLAGFNKDIESKYSDIVIIGQNLEEVPIDPDILDAATSMDRLAADMDKGLGSTGTAKDVKGNKSIPLAHLVFSSADAFIGYNSVYPNYLEQTNERSKAKGKLDDTANNFCYIPKFNLTEKEGVAPSNSLTLAKANESTNVYFKPYLILNEAYGDYVTQLRARLEKSGVTYEELLSEYSDETGKNLHRGIGFPGYMELMGVNDLPERLQLGAKLANNIIATKLNYPDDGSGRPLWLQFITDLRPEWLFSCEDIALACTGSYKETNLCKQDNGSILREYAEYKKFVATHPELELDPNGEIDISEESDDFGKRAYIDDEELRDESYYEDPDYYDEDFMEKYKKPDYKFVQPVSENAKDVIKKQREAITILQESNLLSPDEKRIISERLKELSRDLGTPIGGDGSYPLKDDAEVTARQESLVDESHLDSDDEEDEFENFAYNNEQSEMDDYVEQLINSENKYEHRTVGNIFSDDEERPFEYTEGSGLLNHFRRPKNPVHYDDHDFDDVDYSFSDLKRGKSFNEIYAENNAKVSEIISQRLIKDFGGLSRIRSFRVSGGNIIVNDANFECKLDKPANYLPIDIRKLINSGNVASLFNYGYLRHIKNLSKLSFDSEEFVFDVVIPELGYGYNLSINKFFGDLKSLSRLKIGSYLFTRETYREQIKNNDLLEYRSRANHFASACDNFLTNGTKKSWGITKSFCRDRGLFGKVFFGALGGAITLGLGALAVGAKITNVASNKVSDRTSNNTQARKQVRQGLRKFKNGVSDMF